MPKVLIPGMLPLAATALPTLSHLPFYNPELRQGPSDFNLNNNIIANFTWVIPKSGFTAAPLVLVADGWQLGGIYQVSSGVPFTADIGGDP